MNRPFSQPNAADVRRLVGAADLPTDDLGEQDLAHFLGIGAPCHGVVGLELHGDAALLRSLVVAQDRRGTGDGKVLVAAAEQHARENGVRRIYLLTTTAAPFFARLGWSDADRASAPDAIRATREFSSLCPSTASFMVKELRS